LTQIPKYSQGASLIFVFLLWSRAATILKNFFTSVSCYSSKLLSNKTVVAIKCKGCLLLVLQAAGTRFFLWGSHNLIIQRKIIITLFEQKRNRYCLASARRENDFLTLVAFPHGLLQCAVQTL